MSFRIRAALVPLALSIPGLALAEPYVGLSVVRADWVDACSMVPECDNRNAAGNLRAGYRFSPHLAVEGRYVDLGRVSRVLQRMNVEEQENGTIITYGIQDRFEARGLGVGYEFGRSDQSEAGEDHVNGTRPYYGLRASYAVTRNVDLSLEAERYKVKTFRQGTPDVDTIGVGVSWNFR